MAIFFDFPNFFPLEIYEFYAHLKSSEIVLYYHSFWGGVFGMF